MTFATDRIVQAEPSQNGITHLLLRVGPMFVLTLIAGVLFSSVEANWVPAIGIPAIGLLIFGAFLFWPSRRLECTVFSLSFALYVMIAAVLQTINQWRGILFGTSDSYTFFYAAHGGLGRVSLVSTHIVPGAGGIDSTLSVTIYQQVLDFVHIFEPGKLVWPLLTINSLVAAAVATLTTALAKIVFKDGRSGVYAAALFSVLCPQYMYYSAELLRDGFVELLVVGMLYASAWAVFDPRPRRLVLALITIGALGWLMIFARAEMIVIALAVLGTFFITAFTFGRRTKVRTVALALAIGVVGGVAIAVLPWVFGELKNATEFLDLYIQNSKDSGSGLGYMLVVALPLPLRIIAGSIYQHLFPIPLWAYWLGGGEASSWLNSLNGIWIALLAPAAFVGALSLLKRGGYPGVNRSALLICAMTYLAVLLIVSVTTLEVRHTSAVYPAFFILAATPFAIGPAIGRPLLAVARVWLVAVFIIHIAWGLLKFVV